MSHPLPQWGRPLNDYVSSYQFEQLKQQGLFNEDPGSVLTREADNALEALARIGNASGPHNSSAPPIPVTIQKLQAILKLVQYPKAYFRFVRPAAIGGCIKLMSGIKLNGQYSPFSYEYGYLCFRVLTIVLGVCILHRSNLLDLSIQTMPMEARAHPQHDVMQILGQYVSSGIAQELSEEGEDQSDWIFGWIKSARHPKQHPLVNIPDIELLFAMLWEDRKAFFKSLRTTYYPGISAIIFVLWRVSRRERASTKFNFQSTVVNEISFRYNIIATSDQLHATTYMNIDILEGKYLFIWDENTQQVDLEDCREVIEAYIHRFKPPHPILYNPILVLHGPIFLRSVARFVRPGTEDLLPTVLGVTVKRIWDEMKKPSERHKPDIYVDSIRDTFANYATILHNEVFGLMNYALFQGLVDTIINYDLIDLAARAILMLELPSEPPAPELAGSADYLSQVKRFYGQLSVSIPKQYIDMISDHCLSEWFKFRSYLVWYPEIRRLVPGDRDHMRECLSAWNDIGHALGYQIQERLLFRCLYARCHDPLGMGGIQFTCPVCHKGTYCSSRCQSLHLKFGDPQGLHAGHRVGARALVRF